MQRRKRHRLADGRYIAEITPSVYYLLDVFGVFSAQLGVEHVELPSTLDEVLCESENDPHGSDQAR